MQEIHCKKCGCIVNSANTSRNYGICRDCNPRILPSSPTESVETTETTETKEESK